MERVPQQFSNPAEEVAYLREQLAHKEREVLSRTPELDPVERESIGKQEIKSYTSFTPKMILSPTYELSGHDMAEAVATVEMSINPVEDIMQIAQEKGIKNALSVLDSTDDVYTIDEVHRRLIEMVSGGASVTGMKEGVPPWHVLHMTLYEVTLPAQSGEKQPAQLTELVGTMEQLLAGLRSIGSAKSGNHFIFEIAVSNNSEDIIFYVAVPNEFTSLFEKQTLSLFPHAELIVQPHDYNVYMEGGVTEVAELSLKKHPLYPIKTAEAFATDPLEVVLNAFSKITRAEGAAVQFAIRHPQGKYHDKYQTIVKKIEKGMKTEEAISRSTAGGAFVAEIGGLFSGAKKSESEFEKPVEVDQQALELFRTKLAKDITEVVVRIVVSAADKGRVQQIMTEIESAWNQFDTVDANQLVFTRLKGKSSRLAAKAFSFRQFDQKKVMPLALDELATLAHFPAAGVQSAHQFKQSHAQTAPAPSNMPDTGTLLGINRHRNVEKEIFISDEDRLRHFYIIGQTGTGKTTLMKNMIVQDILRGDGVCMIDPHGTDIEDVLGAVPPERADDVIYFDPSNLDNVVGLNMLEYDYSKPEQKTFVVNELFSIFQKLYGDNPESMGPMFEQYFRNATMLVMEDPESGNTLMDIGRVLSDASYRRLKLAKATNPVVIQFWKEIAGKAGGDAALENIVPYIVSKFDVFTANDYMRPIIGQQKSSFDFREVMDNKKILLVNLSKGRLGEINANLIGMIVVGKLLMAALSRVDDPTKSFPPFYLHMDEFQNISTNSISAILSEARKYKLGLTMAHQFIAQLQPNIKDAVFGNVGSMAAFRVGPDDAQFLEAQYAPTFSRNDLMNVPNRNAFLRVLADGTPTTPFSIGTLTPAEPDLARVQEMIAMSAARYGRPRAQIEADINARYHKPARPIITL
ncbi:MAG: hypothetical protein ACI9SY_000003 [Candidatus Paceibacteria bacterium]|jgi:hypothetical protein